MSLLAQTILNDHLRRAGDQEQLPFIIAAMVEYEAKRNRTIVNYLRAVDKIAIPPTQEGKEELLQTFKEKAAELLTNYQEEADPAQPLVDALKEAKNYIEWLEANSIHEVHVDLKVAASRSVDISRSLTSIITSYPSIEGDTNKSEL
jgi:hypothetical protein